MLLDDARRLHARATDAGVQATLSVVDGMQHVFPFLAGRAPEADEEIAKLQLGINHCKVKFPSVEGFFIL